MVLGCVNRTAWGTRLLFMAVWASLVDCISSCHLQKAQHCSLSPNGCYITIIKFCNSAKSKISLIQRQCCKVLLWD